MSRQAGRRSRTGGDGEGIMSGPITSKLIEDTARELMARAAIDIPPDYREGVRQARDLEKSKLPRFVLTEMLENWSIATEERRPMCADTGLPRYYVRAGNEAVVEGGFVALERALRKATADATAAIPLRPNRVHPLTRADHDNNVGIHAPEITYAFEPGASWIDVTTVHKGGLFGSDYRMLFPADGIPGIKRFFVDTLVQFGKRGLACQPAIVGVGIGAMGFAGTSLVVATHVEVAFSHTGGMPVGMHSLCLSSRRATARIHADGRVEFRTDPRWF